ncbi:MAG: LemA family protein [Dehalococcoidia bacterium]|nr:LemA family protein [Dehalococcoidia bacterium]MDD5494500.1 LemA family protein [Dehalococcoidia bacterium]
MKSTWGCLLAAVGAVVVVAVIIVMALAGIYNSLVTKSQAIDAQWSQVETQYQRRYDLIPNLVNSVKGMMTQEQTVFQSIADARTKYGAAQTVNDKAVAAGEVETALGRLIAVMENYPELKSSQNVTNLMDELAGTENRISVERGRYNEKVRDYNTTIKTFPTNMLAGMFGFTERQYFEAVSGSEKAPEVKF